MKVCHFIPKIPKSCKMVTKKPISDVIDPDFIVHQPLNRIPKSETCKIGRHCPATIEITETDACVTVIHYKIHAGHDLDLKYQKIGKTDKEIIKSMFIFSILVFASYMLSFISFYPVNLVLS